MRIKVAIEGNQSYREHVGEVLHWGSTVESFNEGRDNMAVPCVVLMEDSGRIITLPLKTERTWSKVHEVKAEGAPEVKA